MPPLLPHSKGYPLPPSTASREMGAHAAQGVPLRYPPGLPPPPLPLLHDVHGERTLIRGCPFLVLLVWGSPPLPLLNSVREVRKLLFGGVPPYSALRLRAVVERSGCVRPAWGGPLSPLPEHGLRTMMGGGTPFLLWPLALHERRALPCLGVLPRSLAARRGRALLGGGSPPSPPPWRLHILSACDRSGGLLSLS